MLKHGAMAKHRQFYLKKDGSEGGTRTADTQIMIPLSKTKSPFTYLAQPSNHQGQKRSARPSLGSTS